MVQHKPQCKAATLSSKRCLKSVSEKDPSGQWCYVHLSAPHKEYSGPAKYYYRSTTEVPEVRQKHYDFCHNMQKDEQNCKKNNDVCSWTRDNCQRAFGKKHTLKALQKWEPESQSTRWGKPAQ